jgi:hypothetical protein
VKFFVTATVRSYMRGHGRYNSLDGSTLSNHVSESSYSLEDTFVPHR